MKTSLLLLASFLAITLGGLLLLSNIAFATVMDPGLTGKDYWLTLLDKRSGRAFLIETRSALWLSVALAAVLLCCLVVLMG
jgi:hypothetical protein